MTFADQTPVAQKAAWLRLGPLCLVEVGLTRSLPVAASVNRRARRKRHPWVHNIGVMTENEDEPLNWPMIIGFIVVIAITLAAAYLHAQM